MSNKNRVYVALYSRQGISAVPTQRAIMQHASYHWAIYTESKDSTGTGQSYDVSYEDRYANIPDSGKLSGSTIPAASFDIYGKLPLALLRNVSLK